MQLIRRAIHVAHQAARIATELLDPDGVYSPEERNYVCPVNHKLVLGEESEFTMSIQPDCAFRPRRIVIHVPCYNFVILSAINVERLNPRRNQDRTYTVLETIPILIGSAEDALNYGPGAHNLALAMPDVKACDRLVLVGKYTGLAVTPAGLEVKKRKKEKQEFLLIASFIGPALEAA
jgi:hypothetical protein